MKRSNKSISKATKKHCLEKSYSYMEYILATPGLQHIAEKIISYLRCKDLAKCQQVSHGFQDIIRHPRLRRKQKAFFAEKIRFLRRKLFEEQPEEGVTWYLEGVTEKAPELIFQHFFNDKVPFWELKILVDFIEIYHARKDFYNSPFHVAVQVGHVGYVRLFVKDSFVSLYEVDRDLNTPMHHACMNGQKEMVSLILGGEFKAHQLLFRCFRKRYSLQRKNRNVKTPIFEALDNGHLEIVEHLIKLNDSPKFLFIRDYELKSIHHKVCAIGSMKLALLLIEYHPSGFRALDAKKRTPLQMAKKYYPAFHRELQCILQTMKLVRE